MKHRPTTCLAAAALAACLAMTGCSLGGDSEAGSANPAVDDTSKAVGQSSEPDDVASTTAQAASSTSSSSTTTAVASTAQQTSSTSQPSTSSSTATAPAEPPPDPLAGRSLADICTEEGLTLIAFSFETLQEDFSGTCCVEGGLDPGDLECDLDWPFSDVPDCGAYDRMRNAIYARYGFPFQSARYRDVFGGLPWYRERTDFDQAWLTANAESNVATLLQLSEDRVGCTP